VGLYGVIFQHDPHSLALSRFLVEDEVFTWRRKYEFFDTSLGRYEVFCRTAPKHTAVRISFENIERLKHR
jgi:hypothetical protein